MRRPIVLADRAVVIQNEPVNRLARILYEEMERLDPGYDEYVPWSNLRERDKTFYALSVQALLRQRAIIKAALSSDQEVPRHSHKRE